jgi:hypothetical protein
MDTLAILALVQKGLTVAEAVWENRDLVQTIFTSLKNIVDNHKTVTKTELEAVEADLDAMLDEFNANLPEDK